MTSLEKLAIEAALRKMFAGSYFDICTVDCALRLLGVPQGSATYTLLRTLHCVHFAQMDPELARALPGLISEVFGGVSFKYAAVSLPQVSTVSRALTQLGFK
jgi:hypothetical protein